VLKGRREGLSIRIGLSARCECPPKGLIRLGADLISQVLERRFCYPGAA
jgi:hypothetical protein